MYILFRVIKKKYVKLLVSMLLVLSLGCGIMSGMSNGFLSLKQTLDEYVSEMKYPDVVITTTTTTKDKADLIRQLEGVEAVNPRLKGNLVLIDNEGRYISAEAMTYDEQDFSEFYYWERVEKEGKYPILLEHAFCSNNDVHAGDELTVRLGEQEKVCTVYGVVSRPETLATPSIGNMKVTSRDICYMYVPSAVLEDVNNTEFVKAFAEWEKKHQEYEDAKDKADSEHEKTREEIADSEKKLSEKEKELEEKLSEAEQQKDSLIRNREELKKKKQELDENEIQLRKKKEELAEGEKTLEKERKRLQSAKQELSEKSEEFDRLKKELEKKYNELKGKLDQLGQYAAPLKELRDDLSNAVKDWKNPAAIEALVGKIISTGRAVRDDIVKDGKTEEVIVDSVISYVQDVEKAGEQFLTLFAGYVELEQYEAKIQEGEKQLQEGEKKLKSYRSQIKDGEKKIADGRKEIEKYLIEIENGIEAIEQGIREGKTEFENAQNLLNEAKEEFSSEWAKILRELSQGEKELQNAKNELDGWQGYDTFCNQFLIRVSEGADPEDVRCRAEEALDDIEIKESYTYQTSPLRNKLEDKNLNPLEVMALYIPMVFFGVALIVISLFMTLLVRRCRREIGILRALGYSKGSIVVQFCTVSLMVSLGAVLIGALLGFIVSKFIGYYFQQFFDLYKLNNQFYWGRILLAVAITILVGQTATLLSMGYVNHISPAEAMTRPAPKEAFHAAGIMKKGNSFFKYSLFSLLRNKVRFFFSVICLSASTMLIFTAFSFGASKDKVLISYFEEEINYDCETFFSYEPTADKVEQLVDQGIIRTPEPVRYYKKKISFGDVSEEAVFQAIPKDTEKLRIFDSEENEIRLEEDGVILEKHLAETLGLQVGDVVTIEGESFPLTAISEQYEGWVHYISLEAAERLGEPMFYSMIMDVNKDQQVAASQGLSGLDGYIFASFVDRNYSYWKKSFLAFSACVVVLILFSILIGLVIITNSLHANLLEQKKDLCILRMLGFQCSELSFRLFFQTALYYIFSCLIGLPAGVFVTKTALLKMEMDERSYPFVNKPYLYLQTAFLVLGFLIIGHMISMRTLRKWDLVESVKDKE